MNANARQARASPTPTGTTREDLAARYGASSKGWDEVLTTTSSASVELVSNGADGRRIRPRTRR
jgi:hypothetical protein